MPINLLDWLYSNQSTYLTGSVIFLVKVIACKAPQLAVSISCGFGMSMSCLRTSRRSIVHDAIRITLHRRALER